MPHVQDLTLYHYNPDGTIGGNFDLTNTTVVMHLRVNKDALKYFELSTNLSNLIIVNNQPSGDIQINLSAAETALIYTEFRSGVFDIQVTEFISNIVFPVVVFGTFVPNKAITRLNVPGEIQIN